MLLGAAAVLLTAAPGSPLGGAEALAWVVGVIVGLGALVGALTAIVVAIRRTWHWFWHVFIPWAKKAVLLVSVMTDLPDTLVQMRADAAAHIAVADKKAAALDAVVAQVATLDTLSAQVAALNGRVDLVLSEVKNNGGSSLKDSMHRVERALTGNSPDYTPAPSGTEPIVTRPPKE